MISKNTVCLLFLLYLFFCLFAIDHPRLYSLMGIIVYCMYDLIASPHPRIDMQFHHWLVVIISVKGIYKAHIPWSFIKAFLETEFSTPFLVLKEYGVRHWANSLLFVCSFVYFRIYKLGIVLFQNSHPLYWYEYGLVYSLYLLNWYWMIKIFQWVHRKIYFYSFP